MSHKKFFKWATYAFAALVLSVGTLYVLEAAQITKTTLFATSSDFSSYGYYTHTFTAGDTVTFPIHIPRVQPLNQGTNTAMLDILSSNKDGSSIISFRARYEYSPDNVNWASVTLGTDSTTFYTTLTGSSYLVNAFPITMASHGGYHPYQRVRMWQGPTGVTGNKAKVYVLPQ